jgi:predicted ATP-grasp superfamily ATP-dependent carboligase
MSRPAPAVVVGLDCITGLQTARILAGRGVPVIGIASDPDHFACRTRVCAQAYRAATAGPALIEALERLARTLGEPAVLYPCTDDAVLALSRERERVQERYRLVLPDADVVETLVDKVRFLELAARIGLPIPPSFVIRDRAGAEAAAAGLAYPAVVKPPYKSPAWQDATRAKAFKVHDGSELLAIHERFAPVVPVLIAQEWIDGAESELYSCNCYYGKDGRPLVAFVARKLRQWPPETGTSSLGEAVRNDEVLRATLQLFDAVGYRGLGYVEMKRDARSGRQLVIEPNVGRPTGRSAIAEAGGVELLYTMYCDATGRELPEARVQRYVGARWIYWRHDLQAAFAAWRRGELGLVDWARSWRGRKAEAVFSWSDPAPFAADLARAAGRAFDAAALRLNLLDLPEPQAEPPSPATSDSSRPTRSTRAA